jgi:hypothetical protein
MSGEVTLAANTRGTAPAQHSQEEAHRLCDASLFARARRPAAGFGDVLKTLNRRPRRKANFHRLQWLEAKIAELNSRSSVFEKEGR